MEIRIENLHTQDAASEGNTLSDLRSENRGEHGTENRWACGRRQSDAHTDCNGHDRLLDDADTQAGGQSADSEHLAHGACHPGGHRAQRASGCTAKGGITASHCRGRSNHCRQSDKANDGEFVLLVHT